jgi:hypothetical protein
MAAKAPAAPMASPRGERSSAPAAVEPSSLVNLPPDVHACILRHLGRDTPARAALRATCARMRAAVCAASRAVRLGGSEHSKEGAGTSDSHAPVKHVAARASLWHQAERLQLGGPIEEGAALQLLGAVAE